MSVHETNIGGGGRDFPSTVWSQIVAGADAREGLERLAKAYWKPVYCYLRARWARTNEDAKDLTQDFFVWVMESEFVTRADPRRGRFRTFLKVALDHYAGGTKRKTRRLKRGGDERILSLDVDDGTLSSTAAPERTPEQALDESWKAELLGRSTDLLRETCAREGKEQDFEIFRDYLLAGAGTHEQLAAKHGLTAADVNNRLARTRARFRDIVRALVAETVTTMADLDEEVRALFGEAMS